MKTVTLIQFLTESQIAEAVRLYENCGDAAVAQIQNLVIEPNMAAINKKLGQENDPRYLAYAVVYACAQASSKELS